MPRQAQLLLEIQRVRVKRHGLLIIFARAFIALMLKINIADFAVLFSGFGIVAQLAEQQGARDASGNAARLNGEHGLIMLRGALIFAAFDVAFREERMQFDRPVGQPSAQIFLA